MNARALSTDFGLVIQPTATRDLLAVDWARCRDWFCASDGGLLLFRGFDVDEARFRAFTDAHGDSFVVHHNVSVRDYIDDDRTYATVNRGAYAIDFHCEMAASPKSPDVFWMFCVRPAERRGRTGVVDGVKVLAALMPTARALLEEEGHVYTYADLPREKWSWLLPHGERPALEAWLEEHGGAAGIVSYEFPTPDTLSLEVVKYPIRNTRFSGQPAFVSGMLDNKDTRLGRKPMPVGIRTEVCQATYQNAIWIDWHPGDVLLVDNTRVMHGREAFDDPTRRILVRYSALGE